MQSAVRPWDDASRWSVVRTSLCALLGVICRCSLGTSASVPLRHEVCGFLSGEVFAFGIQEILSPQGESGGVPSVSSLWKRLRRLGVIPSSDVRNHQRIPPGSSSCRQLWVLVGLLPGLARRVRLWGRSGGGSLYSRCGRGRFEVFLVGSDFGRRFSLVVTPFRVNKVLFSS